MGFILDWSGKSYAGFLIVFITSLILSLLDVLTLVGIKETKYEIEQKKRFTIQSFIEPVKNIPYRRFLIFILLFYAAISISSSYTSLYMLRYLELDYKFISFVTVISNLVMIICTRMWRQAEVRMGLKKVFQLTAFIAAIEFLVYFFLTSRTVPLLFLAPIFSGAGNSGFNIFVMNYRYDLMPEKNRSLYVRMVWRVAWVKSASGSIYRQHHHELAAKNRERNSRIQSVSVNLLVVIPVINSDSAYLQGRS